MTWIDYIIFAFYMAAIIGIGFYFFKKNKDHEDYYVGGRDISPSHVGLSIAATDVGGGFSIGLGGLGYAIGLSGSWLLFTGLIGAWLSAVFIIPRVKKVDRAHGMLTYPDFLAHRYGRGVALLAALISGIGYLGFTGAQVLAGAKLMAGTVLPDAVFGIDPLKFALVVMGAVIVLYTVLGGIKAVIYTDTVQWIVLFSGLLFFALPAALWKIGGVAALCEALPAGHLSLMKVEPITFINWMITIIPIWLIGMTLYQRMFACRDERAAKKAWYLAGLFEYPAMAFIGVALGACGRALFSGIESEMAVPMLIKTVLPVGLTGIVVAAYFSAVMSTADSCLMAASGNFVNDLLEKMSSKPWKSRTHVLISQVATLVIGVAAIILALSFKTVLDGILHAYAFMVSGLTVPTLGAFFWKRSTSAGALAAMLAGGGLSLTILLIGTDPPLGLAPSFYGILLSAIVFISVSLFTSAKS
ncbi:sodium:solute symporter family protein [Tichowtungia aerotolerans]|uniref:Sodium:solute symporter family protein n=1 Tax=Tichowtungia aerotolerans TaxID=2697043 RepID=A0A6P1M491_9BACT|nr:sodium:solute symporter family protein [Tichowtungia aerotolerans]QHI68661.1 sodium:solute symporter family protein [Tichowtungia aerotolerans]